MEKRPSNADKLCSNVAAGLACAYGDRCRFSHDLERFVREKPTIDAAIKCYMFATYGHCSYGITCLYSHSHVAGPQGEADGSRGKAPTVDNIISKDLQIRLRKREVDFSRANRAMRQIEAAAKKLKKAGMQSEEEILPDCLNDKKQVPKSLSVSCNVKKGEDQMVNGKDGSCVAESFADGMVTSTGCATKRIIDDSMNSETVSQDVGKTVKIESLEEDQLAERDCVTESELPDCSKVTNTIPDYSESQLVVTSTVTSSLGADHTEASCTEVTDCSVKSDVALRQGKIGCVSDTDLTRLRSAEVKKVWNLLKKCNTMYNSRLI